jgi:type VI secretion system secreted protein Hcp
LRLSRLLAVAVAAAAFAAVAPSAHAASDYFLHVDGVSGESQALPTYINIQSFSFGVENHQTIGSTTTGAGAGKAVLNELEINKPVDATTPVFFSRAAGGQKIAALEILARKSGGAPGAQPYLRYCFQNVWVTEQNMSGDEDVRENLKFLYGSVVQQYTRQNKDGSLMTGANGSVSASWSVLTNNTIAKELWPANNVCTRAA